MKQLFSLEEFQQQKQLKLPILMIVQSKNKPIMKKILIASLAVIALASCKKNYLCECTQTYTNTSGTSISTSSTEIKDVKKKYVESSYDCVSSESTSINSSGDVSTSNIDCSITKK